MPDTKIFFEFYLVGPFRTEMVPMICVGSILREMMHVRADLRCVVCVRVQT